MGAATGDPGQQHGVAALDQGVRRDPLHPERPVVGQRLQHHRRDRHGAVHDVVDRLPGGLDRRPVDLQDPRLGRVDRHPPVVHDPQRVRVDPSAVPPDPRQVGGVDAGGVADHHVEPGLLLDLAQDRVPRVLAVVEPAAGQGPQLVGRDVRGEPGQQDLVVAQDHGVRRDPLPLRKAAPHGPNLRQGWLRCEAGHDRASKPRNRGQGVNPRRAAPVGPTSAPPRCAGPCPARAPRPDRERCRRGGRGTTARTRPAPAGARGAAGSPPASRSGSRRARGSRR